MGSVIKIPVALAVMDQTPWNSCVLERCSESFARSEISLMLLEKNLNPEMEKPVYNLNVKLMGVSGDNILRIDMVVVNF